MFYDGPLNIVVSLNATQFTAIVQVLQQIAAGKPLSQPDQEALANVLKQDTTTAQTLTGLASEAGQINTKAP